MNPNIAQALILASALRLYARTGMRVNRAYTPSAMIRTAARITGQAFHSRAYLKAADALTTWADRQASEAAGDDYLAWQHDRYDDATC